MQELFFWLKWDLTSASLSLCLFIMDLLQYKNEKGSYKSLQGQEAQSWLALEAERNMLQKKRKKKMGKQRSVGSQKKNEAKKCQGIDWTALKTLRGGGWRKPQLQVAAVTECQGYRECEEAEPGENPPSGSPG